MKRRPWLVVLAAAMAAHAAVPAGAEEAGTRTDSLTIGIGGFKPRRSEQAENKRDLALFAGAERRLPSGLRFGIDLNMFAADYRLPADVSCGLLCIVDTEMSLSAWGAVPKAGYGVRLGHFELYTAAGLGLYFATMTARGSTLGFPGEHEEKESGWGTELHVGIRFEDVNRAVGLEMRRLSLKGDFGVLSNNRSIPIGGDFVLITYSMRFP